MQLLDMQFAFKTLKHEFTTHSNHSYGSSPFLLLLTDQLVHLNRACLFSCIGRDPECCSEAVPLPDGICRTRSRHVGRDNSMGHLPECEHRGKNDAPVESPTYTLPPRHHLSTNQIIAGAGPTRRPQGIHKKVSEGQSTTEQKNSQTDYDTGM